MKNENAVPGPYKRPIKSPVLSACCSVYYNVLPQVQDLQMLQHRLEVLWVVVSRCRLAGIARYIALFGLHCLAARNHTLYVVVIQTQHLEGDK